VLDDVGRPVMEHRDLGNHIGEEVEVDLLGKVCAELRNKCQNRRPSVNRVVLVPDVLVKEVDPARLGEERAKRRVRGVSLTLIVRVISLAAFTHLSCRFWGRPRASILS